MPETGVEASLYAYKIRAMEILRDLGSADLEKMPSNAIESLGGRVDHLLASLPAQREEDSVKFTQLEKLGLSPREIERLKELYGVWISLPGHVSVDMDDTSASKEQRGNAKPKPKLRLVGREEGDADETERGGGHILLPDDETPN